MSKDNDCSICIEFSIEFFTELIFRRMAIVYGDRCADLKVSRELAEELFAILEGYRNLHSVEPPWGLTKKTPEDAEAVASIKRIELPDTLFAILRTAFDWWPKDKDAAADESIWIFNQFCRVDGEELYDRFLRVCYRINNTDVMNSGDDGDLVLRCSTQSQRCRKSTASSVSAATKLRALCLARALEATNGSGQDRRRYGPSRWSPSRGFARSSRLVCISPIACASAPANGRT
jgi:hypothetical protein